MNLYETGYLKCPCFWGNKPAKLVKQAAIRLRSRKVKLLKAIDFGCGEGKNANFVAKKGFTVVGIDQSATAIGHAKKICSNNPAIFLIGDMLSVTSPEGFFDLVISTGSVHCLKSENEVIFMIKKMKNVVKRNGFIAFSTFNERKNDFSGHPKNFNPILLPHDFFVKAFSDFELIHCSDHDLNDIHPDNNIKHFHSITRILAMKQ